VRRNNIPLWLAVIVTMALSACLWNSASAQVLYGTLTGNVTDPSGSVVTGARVTAVSPQTGFTRSTTTNGAGIYQFGDLQPGSYTLSVEGTGFAPFRQENIVVNVNQTVRIDAQIGLDQVATTIQVSSAPPPLQTDTAVVQTNISSQQLEQLPTTSSTGRNFQSLYRLIPGSTPPSEQNSAASNPQRSQAVNINGVSNAANTTRIDGAVDQYAWLPYIIAYVPPQDAIANVDVVTASFDAQQGSAGGAAFGVTIKSGTNQFHGSVFEYNSISDFNARNFFQSVQTLPVVPKNIFNQYGFSIGGPIIKDKLFFFGDWESTRIRKTNSGTASVPTQALRNGDFSGIATPIFDPLTGNPATGANRQQFQGNVIPQGRISPAAATILKNLPLPNINTTTGLNNFQGSTPYSLDRDDIDVKITYTPNQTSSLFGHYSISPDTIKDPQQFGLAGGGAWDAGQPGTATGRLQNVGIGFTHTFSPSTLLDGNIGYTRQRIGAQADDIALGNYGTDVLGIPGTNNGADPNYRGIPAFSFPTGNFTGFGNTNTGSPFLFRDNQYTGNLNFSWTKGAHAMRFGGEYIHAALNHFQPGGGGATITPRGAFFFNGGATASATDLRSSVNSFTQFADFLLGDANTVGKNVQLTDPLTMRFSNFAFYAQDTWQASPKLTLTYGLRYEYYPLPVADHFGLFRYDPSVRSVVNGQSVGTVLIGGVNGQSNSTGVSNGWGMIVPRFGVSYRVDDKTVLRSGFGITVDPDNLRNLINAYPANISLALNGPNQFVPAGSLATGIPALPVPDITSGRVPLPNNVSTSAITTDFRRGYIESYNLSIQRELPGSFVANIAYVGSHAVRQQTNVNINAAPAGGGTAGRLLNTTYGAGTNNTDINSNLPFRGSVYNALQAQLTRRSDRYGSTGLIYTYSAAFDISDNSTFSGLTFAYPAYWDRNWARAGYDRPHNFQWWTIEPLPFGKGQSFLKSGLASKLLGGWQVQTILSWVSGTPMNITSSGQFLNAPGNTAQADQIVAHPKINGVHVNGLGQSTVPYVDTSSFADPANVSPGVAREGTAARNSVRGPGFFDLDAGIKRSFNLTDRVAFQLQAESFDLTNTPQFANPSNLNISTFQITPNGPTSTFGNVTTSNAARTLRLSGRVTF
jgi:Carboxypeptidase regulatory-like domain